MSIHKSIKCDECEKELIIDSSYPHHYCLELKCIDTGINTSGMTYAVAMYPLLNKSYQFCGFECLSKWMVKTNNGAAQHPTAAGQQAVGVNE